MNKPTDKPEQDIDLEILVNAVVAAKSAANAAEAALRNFLKKRMGASPGEATARNVPHTFMAKATKMVHDIPEGDDANAGQTAGDGGGERRERQGGDGGEDNARGNNSERPYTEGLDVQQG